MGQRKSESELFDRHASSYERLLAEATGSLEPDADYFAEYKIALASRLLKGVAVTNVLDFGCGVGRSLPHLQRYFPQAQIHGCDPSGESLRFAQARSPAARLFHPASPPAGTAFDVAFITNVLHHIPPGRRVEEMRNCARLVRDGGHLFIFEHNPYNPVTRYVVDRCPFDEDAELLYPRETKSLLEACGLARVAFAYTLFFPRRLRWLRPLERWMGWFMLGAQYYVHGRKQ